MSKEQFLDRLISKLGSMDENNMQAYILRLLKEKGFLQTVFDAIYEGIIVIDRRLRIKYFNQAAKNIIGLPDDISDFRISKLLHEIDWRKILNEDVEEWYRVSLKEIEIFYPSHKFIQFYIVPNEENRELATIIIRDVTENRERAFSEIESEKIHAISLLAAGVAHEIGNPLNSIYLHLQLLQRQFNGQAELDRDEILDLLKVAKGEIERLDSIVNQFLSAVRPSKPRMEIQDLKVLVIDSLKFMRHEIENRKVDVKCSWADYMPNISGDASQLKQAFYNILKNSIQAMPEGGKIIITCSYDDDFVEISFGDSGCGIDAGQMKNIMNPYFTTKSKGNGLGMMVLERIIRGHGAELSIDSEPAKGTIVTIRFPRYGRRMRVLPEPENTNMEGKEWPNR